MSSKVVALVAYDPCAEEFLLPGGDGRFKWSVSTAADSPLPFKKLGGDSGDLPRRPLPPTLETLDFLTLPVLDGVFPADDSR
jgi:hypothetical protein